MRVSGGEILDDLKRARWDTALRTYGNDHSTLIGLLVDWWISGDKRRWAIESGPTNGYSEKGKRGQCDALLGCDDSPVSVLEVEGFRYEKTAKKIGYFFDGKYPQIRPVKFGILLLYPSSPRGKGGQRQFPPPDSQAKEQVMRITWRHPTKYVIVITLDKEYEHSLKKGIRSLNDYYKGTPSKIQGFLYENGQEIKHIDLTARITS